MSDWDVVVHHCDLTVVGEQRFFALAVEYVRDGQVVADPDSGGTLHAHMVAEDALEMYLAMYQINPTTEGIDEAVEIMLREPLIGWTPDEERTVGPAATDADTARQHKRQRIDAHKGRGQLRGMSGRSPHRAVGPAHPVLADSGADDPLEFLKREVPVDPHMVLAKHTEIAQMRELVARDRGRKQQLDAELRDRTKRVASRPTGSAPSRPQPPTPTPGRTRA